MAVGYRSSSRTGQSDSLVSSINVPVPTGAASGDIALVALEQWESGNPTVTQATGFTEIINVASGSQKLKVSWKRLTGADSGNYTFSWTGTQFTIGECILITGGITSGSPVDASNTAISATGTVVPTTTITATALDFLAHFVANENTAAKTAPTSFTEVQDSDYLETNYFIPGSTGIKAAAAGTLSASTLSIAALIGILPDSGGSPQTLVLPVIAATSTVQTPLVYQVIQTSVLAAPSAVLSPAVAVGSVAVQVPVLAVPSTVPNPGVSTFTVIQPGVVNAPSVVLTPTIVSMLQLVTLALLQAPSVVFNPQVAGGGAPVVMAGTIADQARVNMLVNRSLVEGVRGTNADLMALVLLDGAQVLVPKTNASTGTHLLRYMMSLRS